VGPCPTTSIIPEMSAVKETFSQRSQFFVNTTFLNFATVLMIWPFLPHLTPSPEGNGFSNEIFKLIAYKTTDFIERSFLGPPFHCGNEENGRKGK